MGTITDIDEAREAYAYWSARADRLPWHRRADRREARVLAARWRTRLIGAYLERWHLGRLQRLAPLFDSGGRRPRRHVRSLAWRAMRRSSIGRLVLIAFAGVAAAVLACFVSLVLVVALTVHLIAG
jgi:hypothetical protein